MSASVIIRFRCCASIVLEHTFTSRRGFVCLLAEPQEIFTFIFVVVNCAEVAVRALAHPNDSDTEHWFRTFVRWLNYSHWNGYDLVVVVWSVLSSIVILSGSRMGISQGVEDLLELPRALRILRLLSVTNRTRQTLDYLKPVLWTAGLYFVAYSSITYGFALVIELPCVP